MVYFWGTILVIFNLVWLFLVLFNLPGNWLMVACSCGFAWIFHEEGVISVYTLLFAVFIAIIGEVIEFIAGMGGAKKAGSSWKGALGAFAGGLAGGIAGTILLAFPVIGTLLGAALGAGVGTVLVERALGISISDAMKRGYGAGVGVVVGIISKFICGVLIWVIVALAIYVR